MQQAHVSATLQSWKWAHFLHFYTEKLTQSSLSLILKMGLLKKTNNPWPQKENRIVLSWKHKCLGLMGQSWPVPRAAEWPAAVSLVSAGCLLALERWAQITSKACSHSAVCFGKGPPNSSELRELFHVTWNSYHTRQAFVCREELRALLWISPQPSPSRQAQT